LSTTAPSCTGSFLSRGRRRKGPRVLVVEDDPLLAMDLEQALMEAGAREVVISSSMQHAADELERWLPNAVVLDVQLSDRGDGWALAEMVSMLGTRPPWIAFSTGQPEAVPEEVLRLGSIYAKPYDTRVLAADLMQAVLR
jgi:DNA-binding response OmpR family regulator